MAMQLDLFSAVLSSYSTAGGLPLDNQDLYARVAEAVGMGLDEVHAKQAIGRAGSLRSPVTRKIRWYQQTLKGMGVIERVPGERGLWRASEQFQGGALTKIAPGVHVVGFSTNLGVAIWGSCETAFRGLDQPITLVVTSPPYPLRRARAYGNPTDAEYIDFICRALEPVVAHLAPGGSICLNISNDIFLEGLPARSLYRERLVLALCDRFGLFKMDELIWENPSKPPGPVQWASKYRYQLNTAYEPVYWFANDPSKVKADNRRVLQQHTERHLKLIAAGGERRTGEYCDGAYRIRPGDFGGNTSGKIPRNILRHSHSCADSRQYREDARRLGLPVHGAAMPLSLPSFLISLLSDVGDLVVDPFGGTIKTGKAAEELGRRWLVTELVLQYLRGAAERFRAHEGFRLSPAIEMVA